MDRFLFKVEMLAKKNIITLFKWRKKFICPFCSKTILGEFSVINRAMEHLIDNHTLVKK